MWKLKEEITKYVVERRGRINSRKEEENEIGCMEKSELWPSD